MRWYKIIYFPLCLSILTLLALITSYYFGYKKADSIHRAKEPTEVRYTPYIEPDSDTLWALIQSWRIDQGKSVYTRDQRLCEYANSRLTQIEKSFSHDGFRSSANAFLNKTGYMHVVENIVQTADGSTGALKQWLNSPSHLEALEEPNKYSCVRCSGDQCVQIFASY